MTISRLRGKPGEKPEKQKRGKALKAVLEQIAAVRSPDYLANDPLCFCHRYHDRADREVVALLASSFAYGNVKIILRTLESVLLPMGSAPRQFIETFDPQQELKRFASFKHRFNDGRDLVALLWAIRSMLAQAGSIERFFLQFHHPEALDITAALNGFCQAVIKFDYTPLFGASGIPADAAFGFFFPSPQQGSACKRLCMFLRWVVRSDDGIDLGLWQTVSPSRLVIPVDTHICRIARYLGLTSRTTADWKMAQEITANLRQLDPLDPVRYDFALAHLGISDGCNGMDLQICHRCPIVSLCCRNSLPVSLNSRLEPPQTRR